MRVRRLDGPGLLDELGDRLDALHSATVTPVTARRPWLDAWITCYNRAQPFALIAEETNGQLAAAALLAQRKRAGVRSLVPLGDGPSDQIRFPARDAEAAGVLARGIADTLAREGGPWQLTARNLSAEEPVTEALRQALPYTSIAAGAVSPLLRVGVVREARAYVSRNHHQQVRRMRNRMWREGLDPDIDHLTGAEQIGGVLPEVIDVCRARDRELGRGSQMDDPQAGPFFRAVVLAHARRGETVLTTLRLGGQLAAYVLCFVDGDVYRMWNCRFHPEWARYGVGRVANASALDHALDAGCLEFDWMRGEEPYKRAMANAETRAVDLYAASSAVLVAAGAGLPLLRQAARRIEDAGSGGARAVELARRAVR